MPIFRFVVTVLLILGMSVAFTPPASALSAPVDGPIIDPWRAPADRYAAGNRGVDFATAPGSGVAASEAGTVAFAGQVGGTNYVVVEHGDGLRTTYGNVSAILVGVGQRVAAGARIALAADRLHFGLRRGDEYLDPTPYLQAHAILVPLDAANVALRQAATDAAVRWATRAAKDTAAVALISAHPAPTPAPEQRHQVSWWWVLLASIPIAALGRRKVTRKRLE